VQCFTNVGQELLMISSRKICTSYALPKQHIPCDGNSGRGLIVYQTGRRVTRRSYDFPFFPTQRHFMMYRDPLIGLGGCFVWELVHMCCDFRRFQYGLFAIWCPKWNGVLFQDGVVTYHMIDVAVCIDQCHRLEVILINESKEYFFLVHGGATRIKNKRLVVFIVNNVSIFLKGVECEFFYADIDHEIYGYIGYFCKLSMSFKKLA